MPRGRDRRPRAEIRRRHHHAARLGGVRHRRQQARPALLRRGRGHLAEALRDLGPAGRRAARPDRLHHFRFERRHELHADAVSADRGRRRSPNSPASSSSIRRRWKRPSPTSTPRCSPAPSITPSSTIAAPKALTPPKTHWARKIETPPYLAYPVRPGITFTYLGTRVNKQSRMLMKDGKPSANMFAAGEIMAGNVLGKGYAAGIGMTIGSVFGRVAGREAAQECEELDRVHSPRARCVERALTPTLSPQAGEGEAKGESCRALICFRCSHSDGMTPCQRRRADRAARHGLVPCRRTAGRDLRQAGQGSDLHARRRAGEGRSERHLSGRADVRAVFSAGQREGRLSAADVARRRPDRRHLRDHAGRPRRLAELFPAQGLERLQFRRGRARPRRLGAISRYLQGRAGVPHHRQSVRALSHRRRRRTPTIRIRPSAS